MNRRLMPTILMVLVTAGLVVTSAPAQDAPQPLALDDAMRTAATLAPGKDRGLTTPAGAECVARSDEYDLTQWIFSVASSAVAGRQL